ncbi:MAG: transcriptional repressor LexA [Firmicutes bacterium]|nr:transcriptional repressor LexA [Bacillota bacterium]
MQILSEKDIEAVATCIKRELFETGRPPSYRRIMQLCGFLSIGRVQRCVKALKERGELESGTDGSIACPSLFSGRAKAVPLLGVIACGVPITAVENYEDVFRFPEELVGGGEHFMLRAKGDSMTGAGIFDGDLLIFRAQPAAREGQIAATLIGDEATVKTFCPQKDGTVIFRAENPDYGDIVVSGGDCRIMGILVGSYRKF